MSDKNDIPFVTVTDIEKHFRFDPDPRDEAIRDMAEALTKVCRDMQDMRVQSRGYRTAIYMLTKHAAQIKRVNEGESK